MTIVRIVAMALRLLALWLVLLAIQLFGVMLYMGSGRSMADTHWWTALPSIGVVVGAILLWKFAAGLASKLYPGEPSPEKLDIDAESFLRAGCCLLGLWFLTTALPAIMRFVVMMVQSARYDYDGSTAVIQDQALYVAVQLIAIIVLLTRNRALARLLLR